MFLNVLNQTVADILVAYKTRDLSPVAVMEACLAQVENLNPDLNAFVLTAPETARQQAAESEKRWQQGKPHGALDGIPVTIKDWFHVAGWPTRQGSLTSSAIPQDIDAPAVAALKQAGGIIIGKTTLPEFGHKGVTDSPLSGVTRNPWNADKTSGGSSGGAAVAAATGMGLLHLGSDAGGSVRIPASFCGVVGFKPSYGVVPSWPPSLFSTLSALGPITRSVGDAAVMMECLTTPDPRDWHALPDRISGWQQALSEPPAGLKTGYITGLNDVPVQAGVQKAVEKAARVLSSLGTVTELHLDIPTLVDTFNAHWMAVAHWMGARVPEQDKSKMDPRLQHWMTRGRNLALADYLDAERERMTIGEKINALFQTYDVLVMPTTAMTAFDAGQDMPVLPNGEKWDDWTPYTYMANLSKCPAISLPCGLDESNLPVGVQLMSPYLDDRKLLQIAQVLEHKIGFEGWSSRP